MKSKAKLKGMTKTEKLRVREELKSWLPDEYVAPRQEQERETGMVQRDTPPLWLDWDTSDKGGR